MKPAASDKAADARLLGHVKPHWRVFALGVAGMILTALTEPVFPAIMKILLDQGFGETGEQRLMWLAPVMIIGLFLLRGVFTFAMNYAMNYVSQEVLLDLRRDMFTRLVETADPVLRDELVRHGHRPAGQRRPARDPDAVRACMIILVRDTFVIIGLLGWLLYLNWQLTIIALILIPLVALAVGSFSKRMRRLSAEQIRYTGELTGVVEEAIHSNPVVKVYGGQPYERVALRRRQRQVARLRPAHDGGVGADRPDHADHGGRRGVGGDLDRALPVAAATRRRSATSCPSSPPC